MLKELELVGKRFGRLTIVSRANKNNSGNYLWKCKCSCGNESIVAYGALTSGRTRSCGCLNSELSSARCMIDLVGKKFGRITIVERAYKNERGQYLWKCICSCGNKLMLVGSKLVNGHTKSCGCLSGERYTDLLGKRFGKLKVIARDSNSDRLMSMWKCRCDCGEESVVRGTSLTGGSTKSCGCAISGKNSKFWKGGVSREDKPLYNTYADRLYQYEDIRKNNSKLLEARCTYCGRWFVPTASSVRSRIKALNSTGAENRLYCSEACKGACPVYKQILWPKGFKPATSREVQPQLRQLVFERDNHTCQKCGKTVDEAQIHCHHIDPVAKNPIESADMDSCITFCKNCHKEVHQQDGCKYHELRCKEMYHG